MNEKDLVKVEKIEVSNFQCAIRGMRNPLESWHKSDTTYEVKNIDGIFQIYPILGTNDYDLAKRLIIAGSPHRKFIRQIFISADISMGWGIWKEYATYKVGTVENSTSQMHKLGSRLLTQDDFALDTWDADSLNVLNIINNRITKWKQLKSENTDPDIIKQAWRDMLHLIPGSYIYKRTCTLNYEILANMYEYRKNHKQKEWPMLLNKFLSSIPYPEFVTKEFK